jgi:hypothetical protein
VAGSSATWPEVKSRSPTRTACEYGPIALGACVVEIIVLVCAISRFRLLEDGSIVALAEVLRKLADYASLSKAYPVGAGAGTIKAAE